MEPSSYEQAKQTTPSPVLLGADPLLFYTTRDGFEKGVPSVIINCSAMVIFGLTTAFAVYNMVKFYKHRSYALGLFYVFTVLNLMTRFIYFFAILFTETSYFVVVFMCSPANFSCAIGLCQIMNYFVLYIRLDSYAGHRAMKRGTEIEQEDFDRVTVKERVATTLFTLAIVAYPVTIGTLLGIHSEDYNGDVIGAWQRYEIFYMFNFILIAVLLTVSTMITLKYMRKIFGRESMAEERSIKCMLLLFMSSYLVRVIFAIVFHIYQNWVERLFAYSNTIFDLIVLGLWISWDVVPVLCILISHYNNFTSFKDEEILYTEYSVDDHRDSLSQRYSFNDPSEDDLIAYNNLETSGVINLDEPESCSDSESCTSSPNLNRQIPKNSIINKKKRNQTLVSKSLRLDKKRTGSIKMQVSEQVKTTQSLETFKLLPQSKGTTEKSGKTSRTVSARMLKWSLARSIKLGIFSRRVFAKEMLKASVRKSTIDARSRLLINPDSEEFKELQRSKRSNTVTTIEQSESSDEQDC